MQTTRGNKTAALFGNPRFGCVIGVYPAGSHANDTASTLYQPTTALRADRHGSTDP